MPPSSFFELPSHAPAQALPRLRGDRYLTFLSLILLAYACFGRTFAYLGVAPVFPGEVTLVLGLGALLLTRAWYGRIHCPTTVILLCLMLWGALRTLPYISSYGINALRDGAIWGYGLFALIVAGIVAAHPQRLVRLVQAYGTFCMIFIPFAALFTVVGIVFPQFALVIPIGQGSEGLVLALRHGEISVHLTAVLIFIFLGLRRPPGKAFILTTVLVLLVLLTRGRATFVTVALGFGIYLLLGKVGQGFLRYLGLMVVFGIAGLAIDMNIASHGADREIAVDQFFRNVASIFSNQGDSGLIGTKLWRLNWWNTIIGYTFGGEYFLFGKGFGINLATSDGFQVLDNEALRSPHSIHFTWLGRGGVPGLMLWLAALLSWSVMILRRLALARSRRQEIWQRLFIFLFVCLAAFLANASFDVYLEGPQGGIWFWCLFGFGIAASRIYDASPALMTGGGPGIPAR